MRPITLCISAPAVTFFWALLATGCAHHELPTSSNSEPAARKVELSRAFHESLRNRVVVVKRRIGSNYIPVGTGVLVKHQGQLAVITALHNLSSAAPRTKAELKVELDFVDVQITLADGTLVRPKKVTGSADFDVAILSGFTAPSGGWKSKVPEFSASIAQPTTTAPVVVWGTPWGYGPVPMLSRIDSITTATFKSQGGGAPFLNYNLALPAQNGVSGGPVFDMSGHLIGIVYSGREDSDGIPVSTTLAVSATTVLPALQALLPSGGQ